MSGELSLWLKICGGALLCIVCITLLKQTKTESLPMQWVGHVLITLACLGLLQPLLSWLKELSAAGGVNDTLSLLLRGLAVALLTQLCADMCRQGGDATLATGVENAGKIELLLLCLPLLEQLLQTARELLSYLP